MQCPFDANYFSLAKIVIHIYIVCVILFQLTLVDAQQSLKELKLFPQETVTLEEK